MQHEPSFRPTTMNASQRHQFVQKAKADSLAFEAAQLLSRGETVQAFAAAGQCITIAGNEQFAVWLRHYATTRFNVASRAVEEFLGGMPAAVVAL
jgi:hypothetical protein